MIDRIADTIAQKHDVTLSDILGPSHMPHIVRPRWEVMVELRRRGWSLTRIGNAMNRHHTTVLEALRKMGAA